MLAVKNLPISLGDDFHGSIGNLDGSLRVGHVAFSADFVCPLFGVFHDVPRATIGVEVRKDRKVDNAESFVASPWRVPPHEIWPDPGRHRHASTAKTYPNL